MKAFFVCDCLSFLMRHFSERIPAVPILVRPKVLCENRSCTESENSWQLQCSGRDVGKTLAGGITLWQLKSFGEGGGRGGGGKKEKSGGVQSKLFSLKSDKCRGLKRDERLCSVMVSPRPEVIHAFPHSPRPAPPTLHHGGSEGEEQEVCDVILPAERARSVLQT